MAHIHFDKTARLTLTELESLKQSEYSSFESVFCPLLGEAVVFRANGFHHMLRDGKGKYRNEDEQRERLNLLSYAPEIIANSIKLGAAPRIRRMKRQGITKQETQYRLYYQLQIAGRLYEIAVILYRRGENGALHFYSVFKVNESSRSKKAD